MINGIIALCYVAIFIHQRDRISFSCLSAFFMCFFITTPWNDGGNVTLDYLLYFSIYATLSYYLINHVKNLMSGIGAVIIALYDLMFALDCYLNESYTYIWRHHETTVVILHALLMCLYSQKCNSTLRSGWYNVCMLFNTYVFNQPSSQSNGRQAGEESYK